MKRVTKELKKLIGLTIGGIIGTIIILIIFNLLGLVVAVLESSKILMAIMCLLTFILIIREV